MKKYLLSIFSLTLVVGIFFTLDKNISAQEENSNQSYVVVSPVVHDITMRKGESKELEIKVTNNTDKVVELSTRVENFVSDPDEGGDPIIKKEADLTEGEERFMLSRWVSLLNENLVLQPGQKIKSKVLVTVPDNAEPGGKYGVVIFSHKMIDNSVSQIGVTSELGTLLIVKVDGAVTESAKVIEFGANKKLYWKFPATIHTRVQNNGNVHLKPFGTIEIINKLTKRKKITTQFNDGFSNVLPDSIRRYENLWERGESFIPPMGVFTAKLTAVLYPGNSVSLENTFFVIPIVFILEVFLAVAALIALLKLYNRWIIRRAKMDDKMTR